MSSEEREQEQQVSPLDSGQYVRQPGLGDLNRQLSTERGENFDQTASRPQAGYSHGSYAPPDMLIQTGILDAAQDVPLGTPAIDVEVTSTYKARKVNAVDFLKTLEGTLNFLTASSNEVMNVGFIVPDNKVCVLAGFKYSINPYNNDIDDDEITANLTVDGVPDAFYREMHLGQHLNDYQECYILAPPGSRVALTMSTSYVSPIPPGSYTATIGVKFYGQMLVSKGLPTNFEPGNLRRGIT